MDRGKVLQAGATAAAARQARYAAKSGSQQESGERRTWEEDWSVGQQGTYWAQLGGLLTFI